MFEKDLWNLWYSDLIGGNAGFTLKVKNILYSGKSDFQRIDVLENEEMGRFLVLYGAIMITEKDEFIYHEMITHVPLFVHENAENVLVIGGGDGCTLREILKHKNVKKITEVEIDRQVVEISKNYFSNLHNNSFDDERIELVFEDGFNFLKKSERKFDIIISDGSDPVGPAKALFQKSFYKEAKRSLRDKGIFVSQTESPFFHPEIVKKIYRDLRETFSNVQMFLAFIPSYPSGMWSFSFCSDYWMGNVFKKEKFLHCGFKTKYYNPEIHSSSFVLPEFVKELISE